jgi:hypothetical protein
VTPFGDLVADSARGTLMGNRGALHDDAGRIVRHHRGRRWIACSLEFRGRRRAPMPPGRYTALFFLDEATALAAGHRPCFECRRADAERFRERWAAAAGARQPPGADAMDRVLHAERAHAQGAARASRSRLRDLPDGTMVGEGEHAFLVLGGALLAWSPDGYRAGVPPHASAEMVVLTPPSIVATIRAGYVPAIHPSAAARGSAELRAARDVGTDMIRRPLIRR